MLIKNGMKKRLTIVFILGLIFIAVLIGGVYFYQKKTNSLINNPVFSLNSVFPTPFPFQELTIPYLRSRSYKSSLNEKTLYANGSNYKSYLTSYDSDGLKINGLLTVPDEKEPEGGWPASNASQSDAGWPAIIFIHGYIPQAQYQTTQNYYDYVDYLARNGFVVFKIDLRGHGSSEGEPGGAYYSSDYVVDILNAYSALQNSDFVNPKRIGLWGHSMAGNVTLRTLAVKPEIPALNIWAGAVYSYTDQQKYGIRDSSYQPPAGNQQRIRRRQELFDKNGQPGSDNIFWQQLAPTNYLSDLKGAIQINHAIDDDVVNIGYSRDLIKLLDATSVPHQLNEYPSGGHNITGSSFTQAMQNTVSFFNKYLTTK